MDTLKKKHQEALFDLLQEFDRVCRKHQIKYVLFCGTALGAVRHKGFIPWDDDLDVGMLRSEYARFLEVAPAELGEKYFLQAEFSENWSMFFSKLRKTIRPAWKSIIPSIHIIKAFTSIFSPSIMPRIKNLSGKYSSIALKS